MRKNKGCREEMKRRGGGSQRVEGEQWHWRTWQGGPDCAPQEPLKKQATAVQVCKPQRTEDGDSWPQAEAAPVRPLSPGGPTQNIQVNGT